jgi:hypothetical protein
MSDDGRKLDISGNGARLLGWLSVLLIVLFLGDCNGGLTRLREQACIYKTGNAGCKP